MSFSSGIRLTVIVRWVAGFFLICLVTMIVGLSLYTDHLAQPGCYPQQMYGRYFLQSLVIIATTISLFLVRDVEDTKGLKWEILATNIMYCDAALPYAHDWTNFLGPYPSLQSTHSWLSILH